LFGLKKAAVIKELSMSFVTENEEAKTTSEKSKRNSEDQYFLNRKLVISADGAEVTIPCTGFISTPSILFDPYSSNPKHIATVMDHR
jgi:hypothetical protein